jgi:hypothetical protein
MQEAQTKGRQPQLPPLKIYLDVIPGRREATNPESRDSGFDALESPRNDNE